jgi:peptidoglycan/LPS O-acetylase OafA/YrhL
VSVDASAEEAGPRVASSPELPVLDTLRFVGALCVLTTHVAFEATAYARHGIWGALLSRLDVGVAIFFVLSGFLLFRPYLAAAAIGRAGPRTGRYYWKRLLRIYPVYVVTVVLALALIPENDGTGPLGWLRTMLMLDGFTEPNWPYGLTQMWSLAVEACFYLVLPGLAVLALGRRSRPVLHPARLWAVVAGMVAISLAWHVVLGGDRQASMPGTPMNWLPSYLTWFAVGMVLAHLHVQRQRGDDSALVRAATTLGSMPGACWAAVAGLMLVAATPLGGPTQLYVATPAESTTKHLLYAAIGGLVVVTGAFGAPRSGYVTAMSHPVLRHLGHISYSTFCLHMSVLYFVMDLGGFPLFGGSGVQIWLLTLSISLVVSELCYRVVELPVHRLRHVRPPWRPPTDSHPSSSPQKSTTSS